MRVVIDNESQVLILQLDDEVGGQFVELAEGELGKGLLIQKRVVEVNEVPLLENLLIDFSGLLTQLDFLELFNARHFIEIVGLLQHLEQVGQSHLVDCIQILLLLSLSVQIALCAYFIERIQLFRHYCLLYILPLNFTNY